MAKDVAVKVEGLKELRRDLRRLDKQVDRELTVAIKHAADKVTITAGALAPRRSGDLAHSLRPSVRGATASIRSTLPYAGVVHWGGTIRPRGTPILFKRSGFITRAIRDHTNELVDDIGDAIENAARATGWH